MNILTMLIMKFLLVFIMLNSLSPDITLEEIIAVLSRDTGQGLQIAMIQLEKSGKIHPAVIEKLRNVFLMPMQMFRAAILSINLEEEVLIEKCKRNARMFALGLKCTLNESEIEGLMLVLASTHRIILIIERAQEENQNSVKLDGNIIIDLTRDHS